ncbi:uncharacterized protein LOC142354220 [Convolutriloba macropyga]|uniref:uncharacterized protein LOC142354220 n=1 Tax=Convolutriloba macropyga TaxID=536237 RepID=UPI003F5277A7
MFLFLFTPWADPATGDKLDFDILHYTVQNSVAAWDLFVCVCILVLNCYCLLCFLFVKELRAIEFGLIALQTVTDIVGSIFYSVSVTESYMQRYLFYCMEEWKRIQILGRTTEPTSFFFIVFIYKEEFENI